MLSPHYDCDIMMPFEGDAWEAGSGGLVASTAWAAVGGQIRGGAVFCEAAGIPVPTWSATDREVAARN